MKTQKHQMSWFVVFAVALSLGFVPQAAFASEATGQFMYNNKSVQFTHAYALVRQDPFDETKEVVMVIMTDAPLSDEAVEDEWVRRAMTRDNGLKYVEFTINSNKQPSAFLLMLDPSKWSSCISVGGQGMLELKVFDTKNVAGRFYTDGEVTINDTPINYDFTFQAEIRRKKEAPLSETNEVQSPQEKFKQTVADMKKIVWALVSYQMDTDEWPPCPSEKDLSEIGLAEKYYTDMNYTGDFKDAWGTPFKYVTVKDGKEFVLTSYGADKAKGDGTDKFDADIVCEKGRFVEPASVIEELYGE